MNWSKIKIHYIASIHLLWMIVPFVCLHSTNTTKTANGNNNNKQIRPIHSQTKIQYRKIKSCQFGWLLLRLPFRRHWAYVRSVGLSSKHAEQIIHTNKRIESPPFPFRLFMLFFFSRIFFHPLCVYRVVATGIIVESLASSHRFSQLFLQMFDTFFWFRAL